MIAKRRRWGTTSRKSSTRLPARSDCWTDRPVMLPPGRARLATRPPPTGSVDIGKTMGMTAVACFTVGTASPYVNNDVDLEPYELGRDFGDAPGPSLRPAILDRDGATLDPAQCAQPVHKSSRPRAPCGSVRSY